jgi:hypothetical protein
MIAIAALLIDDAPKAQTQLGWQLTVFFKEMIPIRVNADLKRLSQARNSVPEAHGRSRISCCEKKLDQCRRLRLGKKHQS